MGFSLMSAFNITFNPMPQFYLQVMRSVSCLGLLVNLFGMYVVVCQSPAHFKSYKWHLANNQFWSMSLDFFAGLMVTPVFFLPMPVGYPTGILATAVRSETLLLITTLLIFVTLASILHMLFYRWQQIVPTGHWLKFGRTCKLIMLLVMYCGFLVPHFILFPQTVQNQSDVKQLIVYHFEVYEEIIELPNLLAFYLPTNVAFMNYLLVCAGICTFFVIALTVFLFHTTTILRRKDKYANFKTQIAHRKYITILSTQMSIPMVVILEPAVIIGFVIIFRIWNVQELVHLAFFTFANHGFIGTITMLYLNEHYKLYLAKKFCNARDPDEPRPISLNALANDERDVRETRGNAGVIRVVEFDQPCEIPGRSNAP